MALLVKLEDEAPLQERGRLGGPAEGMSFLTSSTSELQEDDQLFSSTLLFCCDAPAWPQGEKPWCWPMMD